MIKSNIKPMRKRNSHIHTYLTYNFKRMAQPASYNGNANEWKDLHRTHWKLRPIVTVGLITCEKFNFTTLSYRNACSRHVNHLLDSKSGSGQYKVYSRIKRTRILPLIASNVCIDKKTCQKVNCNAKVLCGYRSDFSLDLIACIQSCSSLVLLYICFSFSSGYSTNWAWM